MIRVGDRVRTHTRLGRPVYGTVDSIAVKADFFGRDVGYLWVMCDDGQLYLRRFDDITIHAPARVYWK